MEMQISVTHPGLYHTFIEAQDNPIFNLISKNTNMTICIFDSFKHREYLLFIFKMNDSDIPEHYNGINSSPTGMNYIKNIYLLLEN